LTEPAFDEIQPGTTGGSEVQLEPRVGGQPLVDRRRLVRGVVVADQVQVQLGGGVLVDGLEEPQELLMAVPPLVLADDLAGGDVQGGEQAGGAVPDVVVGLAARRAAPGLGSSTRPSRRSVTNRARHLHTVWGQIPNLAATSLFVTPSAHASTILARSANACEVFARRVHRSSVSRSTSDRTSSAFGRPERAIVKFYTTYSTDQRLRIRVVLC